MASFYHQEKASFPSMQHAQQSVVYAASKVSPGKLELAAEGILVFGQTLISLQLT